MAKRDDEERFNEELEAFKAYPGDNFEEAEQAALGKRSKGD